MFTGRYEPIPYSGQLTTPTTGQTMVSSFKADYQLPFLLTPGMEATKRKEVSERVNALRIQSELGDQGVVQKSLNWLSGMAGSILNPYSLATGEVIGIAAKPLIARGAGLVGRYLPSEATAVLNKPVGEIIGKRLPEFVNKESAGSLVSKGISGYAQATGFSLPGEIAATYEPKTDKFDWQRGIKASFEDGGFGLAMMSTPYLAGILWGKMFRGVADHTKMPLPGEKVEGFSEAHVDDAVKKGWMTPQEGQWFKDYMFKNDSNENLATRGTQMLIKDGHPVNSSTNQAMFKILGADDVNNFQTAVADELANKVPEHIKPMYRDYVGHNRIDNLRENPSVLDGLDGVVNFTRKRLAKAPEEMVEFHKLMKKLLPESIKEENPLTQAKIHLGEKRAIRTGLTVPEQVETRLKQEGKIKQLKNTLKQLRENYVKSEFKTEYNKKIQKTLEKIKGLEDKLQPLLSHKEEIQHLREKLMPDGKVVEGYKFKREYQRLLDLTKVRNDARKLMHEVNLRHEYELHEAYANMLETITKVMRSEFGKLAKPENVNTYLSERFHHQVPEFRNLEIEGVKKEVKVAREKIDKASSEVSTPEKQADVLKTMDTEVKESSAKENKKEFEEIKSQYDEFKENENVFSSLIKCVMGSGANV